MFLNLTKKFTIQPRSIYILLSGEREHLKRGGCGLSPQELKLDWGKNMEEDKERLTQVGINNVSPVLTVLLGTQ